VHCRLLLPAGLDPGPVAIHLLSTQDGLKGVLLGSATTMALPLAAAAELQDAHSLQIGDSPTTKAKYQSMMRDLVRDYALCWHLCHQCSASGGSFATRTWCCTGFIQPPA
jgi:hypothetical protein